MRFNIENRRYTGSKAVLANWIISIILDDCKGNSFTDIFAGTGIIAQKASKHFQKIIVNDLLYSNNVAYKAFFLNGEYDKKKLKEYSFNYANINSKNIENNYFSKNFGDKFFNFEDAKKIGFIREDIEKNKQNLTKKEYNILITSLFYSADKIANTVGHYDAYFKTIKPVQKFVFELINLAEIKNIEIYREDANQLVKKLKSDIVYIDPPYNSRQYSRFYHILENIVKWDKPKLHGIALKPEPENMSDYCRVKAPVVFENLINDLNCSYIAVSYNNTYTSKSNSSKNKITLEQIEDVLKSTGETKIYERSHKYFNSGKTKFNDHKEFLFITKVS
jgi:adenine-specific DNA-methyltransferase